MADFQGALDAVKTTNLDDINARTQLEETIFGGQSQLLCAGGDIDSESIIAAQGALLELISDVGSESKKDSLNWLLGLTADFIQSSSRSLLKQKSKEEQQSEKTAAAAGKGKKKVAKKAATNTAESLLSAEEEEALKDHVETMVMVAEEYRTHGQIPNVINFSYSVLIFTYEFVAKVSHVSDEACKSLLSDVDSLRKSFKNLAVASSIESALPSTKAKAVGALRDVLLFLVSVTPEEANDIEEAGITPFSTISFPSAQKEELLGLDALVNDTVEGLLNVLSSTTATATLLTTAFSSILTLIRCKPRLWGALVSGVTKCVQIFFVDRKSQSGKSVLHTSFAAQRSLHQVLKQVMRTPKAVTHHHACKNALLASGGEVEKPGTTSAGSPLSSSVPSKKLPDGFFQAVVGDQIRSNLTTTGEEGDEEVTPLGEAPGEGQQQPVSKGPRVLATTNLTGPITRLNVIAAMVLKSLQALSADAEKIENQHLKGLREMQLVAAQKAQDAELERIRIHESRSIAEVQPGRLVEHVEGGSDALESGSLMLDNDRQRALFAGNAFLSALKTCFNIKFENDARMRHANAVVARSLCQMPPEAADSTIDAFCDALEGAIEQAKRSGATSSASAGGESETGAASSKTSSSQIPSHVHELVMQCLFMKYSQLAVQPQASQFSVFAFTTDGAAGDSTSDAELARSAKATLSSGGAGAGFEITLDEPAAWLQTRGRKKRNRLLDEEFGADSAGVEALLKPLEFQEDVLHGPTSYSHFFRRLLFVFHEAGAMESVESLVFEAPCLTTPIWVWIYSVLCDSIELSKVKLGVQILYRIIQSREVYRQRALSLLLHLSSHERKNNRLLAITYLIQALKKFRSAGSEDQHSASSAQSILEYASRSLSRISEWRLAKFEAEMTNSSDEEVAKARLKYDLKIRRNLSLFLWITPNADYTTAMLKRLLGVFETCSRENNNDAQAALLRSDEFNDFIKELYRTDFITVLTEFRVSAGQGSERLVQHGLRIFAHQLKIQAFNKAGNRSTLTSDEELRQRVTALITTCETVFNNNGKDCRFILPVLSFLERRVLKTTYIPALLQMMDGGGDVQKELQAREEMDLALREISLNPCQILFYPEGKSTSSTGGAVPERGLGPVDLLVYLHEIHALSLPGVRINMIAKTIQRVLKLRLKAGDPESDLVFDEKTTEDGKETHGRVRKTLDRLIKMNPVPTLTMHTVLNVANDHRASNPALIRWITLTVVDSLIAKHTWSSDPDLWRGVIMYIQAHWPGTHSQFVRLPDEEQLQALRTNEKLKRLVQEEVKNPGTPLFALRGKVEML